MASHNSSSSPTLDPKVNDFVPNDERSNASSSSSARRKPNLALIPSSKTREDGAVFEGPSFSSAAPLHPSGTWSASVNPAVRSAGLPAKPSWDSLRSTNKGTSFPSASTRDRDRSAGFGVSTASNGGARQNNSHRLDFTPSSSAIRYTQTEEYHKPTKPSSRGNLVVRTDPLPQHPFSHPDQGSGAAIGGHGTTNRVVPQHLASSASQSRGSGGVSLSSGGNQDSATIVTPVRSTSNEEDIDPASNTVDGDWTEGEHSQCLRRALKDPEAEWEEVYEGAVGVLADMNPQQFNFPANSRIVNIKTEFPQNLVVSLRLGKYSVMAKISERIMEVWDPLDETSAKVFFLFSVNGSKKFSGLAELTGPWDKQSFVDGWSENPESHGCVGSFPVTWIYAKDLPYHRFNHIRQPGTDNPVGNMWNGMLFPPGLGRKVVEHYVKLPATASMLGYPKNYPDNDHSSSAQRKGTFGSRAPRPGGRGSFKGSKINTPARPHQRQTMHEKYMKTFEDEQDDDATPTPASRGRLSDASEAPPTYGIPAISDLIAQGEVGSRSFDSSGNYIAVPNRAAASSDGSSTYSEASTFLSGAASHSPRRPMQLQIDTRPNVDGNAPGSHSGLLTAATLSGNPKYFSAPASNNHMGLPHSASMGMLRPKVESQATMRPLLQQSGSMNSLPLRLNWRDTQQEVSRDATNNDVPRSVPSYDQALTLHQSPSPAALSRELQYNPGQSSPTRAGFDNNRFPSFAGTGQDRHQLLAKHHALQAERHRLQSDLYTPGMTRFDHQLINAKLVTNAMAIQTTEMEMSLLASRAAQSSSPERSNSYLHGDDFFNPPSSGYRYSPERAGGNAIDYSPCPLGSPSAGTNAATSGDAGHYHAMHGNFQYAQPRFTHGSQSSWDRRAQNVDSLVSSPQNHGMPSAASRGFSHQSLGIDVGPGNGSHGRQSFNFQSPNTAFNSSRHNQEYA
ncbi:YTH domain-containing family protein 3 [Cercospora zeina]